MKGYVKQLTALIFTLILFYVVNLVISQLLKSEAFVSDAAAWSYKMVDAIEFAKLNANQALKFSVEKTATELGITDLSIFLQNEQQKANFLGNLTENFNPSLKYSEVDVLVSVNSIEIKDNKITIETVIYSVTPERQVETPYILTYPIQKA